MLCPHRPVLTCGSLLARLAGPFSQRSRSAGISKTLGRHVCVRPRDRQTVSDIQVGPAEPVSPHNQALYEAGKQMLVESISVGREFCKFMVGVSTGAIPLYLALLQLALPK